MPTINRCGGGGSGVKLNIYAQPDLPTDKFDGILLQTAAKENFKKVVFDDDVWASEQWMGAGSIPDYPTKMASAGCCVDGNTAYFFGGESNIRYAENAAIAYNFGTKAYQTLSVMPIAAEYIGCAVYNHKIYLCNFYNGTSTPIRYFYCYDIATDTYTRLTDLPYDGRSCSVVPYSGKLFFFGFASDSSGNLAYDTSTNTFSEISKPVQTQTGTGGEWVNMRSQNGAAVYGSKAYIFTSRLYALSYDFVTDTYAALAAMPSQKNNPYVLLVGNEVFIFSGISGSYTNWAYNIATNTYRTLADAPTSRYSYIPAVCNGIIGLFGGVQNYNNYLNYASNTFYQNVDGMSLTAKQYPDTPSIIISAPPGATEHHASILSLKQMDKLPLYFRDAVLFKDGSIAFPALYIGDGSTWNKEREAQ